ncbi:MAG: hypothetical protein JW956_05830 [Calditrichaceae bacterium]|nr:hypothetical protein [Calditrichaceae bacterium]
MFKSIFRLIVLIALLAACSDIERDNPLDPKNPDSYSETPILIEAFVNNQLEYVEYATQALNQIEAEFSDQVDIIIVEYHRVHPVDTNNLDVYANPLFDGLHQDYADNYENPKGVPDIYVNGSQGRVFGAYDINSVYYRLSPIISDLAGQQSKYSLEVDLETSGNQLNVDYRLARLGKESDQNLQLHVVLIKDYGIPGARRIVDKVTYPDAEFISKIDKGEYAEGSIDNISCPNLPNYALFALTKQGSITVLKTLKKEILW